MAEKYRVLTGDNFHAYDDDDGADDCGSCDTQEEAIEAAKLIVDKSSLGAEVLRKAYRSR